jgi:hypothetical protein
VDTTGPSRDRERERKKLATEWRGEETSYEKEKLATGIRYVQPGGSPYITISINNNNYVVQTKIERMLSQSPML